MIMDYGTIGGRVLETTATGETRGINATVRLVAATPDGRGWLSSPPDAVGTRSIDARLTDGILDPSRVPASRAGTRYAIVFTEGDRRPLELTVYADEITDVATAITQSAADDLAQLYPGRPSAPADAARYNELTRRLDALESDLSELEQHHDQPVDLSTVEPTGEYLTIGGDYGTTAEAYVSTMGPLVILTLEAYLDDAATGGDYQYVAHLPARYAPGGDRAVRLLTMGQAPAEWDAAVQADGTITMALVAAEGLEGDDRPYVATTATYLRITS